MRIPIVLLTVAVTLSLHTSGFAQGPPAGIISSVNGANADSIFYDFNLSNLEKIVASVKFTETNQKPKVTFVPFTFASSKRTLVNTIVTNFAQDGGVSTFGAGISFANTTGFNKRAQNIWDQLDMTGQVPKPFRNQLPNESNETYALLMKEYNNTAFDTVNDLYYAKMAKNSWSVVVGSNASAFAVVGGDKVDQDEDGVIDNEFNMKGFTHTASLSYTFNQSTALTASAYYGRRRAEAKASSIQNAYPGWSLTFGRTVVVLNENYTHAGEYRESGFIPGVVAGGSIEYQRCNGSPEGCDKGILRQTVITPFADIKLAQSTQFRLGVPIQRQHLINTKSKNDLGIAVQLALQLRNLN